MTETTDSAVTAAELDALDKRIRWGWPEYEILSKDMDRVRKDAFDAVEALRSLRKQLDEARERDADWAQRYKLAFDQWESWIMREKAANAQMAAALRRIEQNSEPGSRNNRIARHALGIEPVDPTLTASQEAPASPAAEVRYGPATRTAPSLFAPASPSPGLDKDQIMNAVLAAGKEAAKRGTAGREDASPSPGLAEDECLTCRELPGMGSSCPTCASPSPGLREAVIEECARLVREKRLRLPEPEDRTEFGNGRHSMAWEIEQDLVALSRPVSEREGDAK